MNINNTDSHSLQIPVTAGHKSRPYVRIKKTLFQHPLVKQLWQMHASNH